MPILEVDRLVGERVGLVMGPHMMHPVLKTNMEGAFSRIDAYADQVDCGETRKIMVREFGVNPIDHLIQYENIFAVVYDAVQRGKVTEDFKFILAGMNRLSGELAERVNQQGAGAFTPEHLQSDLFDYAMVMAQQRGYTVYQEKLDSQATLYAYSMELTEEGIYLMWKKPFCFDRYLRMLRQYGRFEYLTGHERDVRHLEHLISLAGGSRFVCSFRGNAHSDFYTNLFPRPRIEYYMSEEEREAIPLERCPQTESIDPEHISDEHLMQLTRRELTYCLSRNSGGALSRAEVYRYLEDNFPTKLDELETFLARIWGKPWDVIRG